MDTYPSSSHPDPRARKNGALILQALARTGLSRVAEDLGKDVSTVSRMKEQQIPALAQLLSSVGLKVVPVGYKCVDADTYKLLKRWAVERLQADDDSPSLEWD